MKMSQVISGRSISHLAVASTLPLLSEPTGRDQRVSCTVKGSRCQLLTGPVSRGPDLQRAVWCQLLIQQVHVYLGPLMHATVPHSNSVQKDTRHYHVDSHHGTRHPAVCESGACRCCRELVALIGPRASIARPPVRLDCVRLASENRRRAQRRARRVPCVHVLLFSDRASSALLPPPSKKNRAPTGRPERSSIIAPASDLCCPLALNRPPHWQHPE